MRENCSLYAITLVNYLTIDGFSCLDTIHVYTISTAYMCYANMRHAVKEVM